MDEKFSKDAVDESSHLIYWYDDGWSGSGQKITEMRTDTPISGHDLADHVCHSNELEEQH